MKKNLNYFFLATLLMMILATNTIVFSSGGSGGGSTSQPYKGTYSLLNVYQYVTYPNLPSEPWDIIRARERLTANGWSKRYDKINSAVTASDFRSPGVDLLYYSGHGIDKYGDYYGGIALTTGGYDYNIFQEQIGKISGVKWIFLGSCYTVQFMANWGNAFSPNSSSVHTICGYNDVVDTNEKYWVSYKLMYYLLGETGYGQRSVWQSWKQAHLDENRKNWSVFFLYGAKDEVITNPISNPGNYDVWQADQWDPNGLYWQPAFSSSISILPAPTKRLFYSAATDSSRMIPMGDASSIITPDTEDTDKNAPLVSKSLNNNKIILKYKKPQKKTLPVAVTVSPEFTDYTSAERNFYTNNTGKLNLLSIRKFDIKQKIQYTNGNDNVLFFKPTGGILYDRNSSGGTLPIMDAKSVYKKAIALLKQYGLDIPKDAVLRSISPVVLTNVKTGEKRIQSYVLYYKKQFHGVDIAGPGADGITVEIDADGITYYQRLWRNYDSNTDLSDSFLDEAVAFQRNATKIQGQFMDSNEPLQVNKVRLVYKASSMYEDGNTAVPSWEYTIGADSKIYVDAINGELLQ